MVQRRLELLKMEGLGFNQAEIVKQLSEKYRCSARAIYFDFERRLSWQPTLLQLSNQEKVLLKVINRYEQIYRQAVFKCLTAANILSHSTTLESNNAIPSNKRHLVR